LGGEPVKKHKSPIEWNSFFFATADQKKHVYSLLPITKTPPNKKKGLVWHFRFILVGHNWILHCGNWESIGEQDGETMGSTP